jgi:myo-inositol-1(or 4)-monophosphatase
LRELNTVMHEVAGIRRSGSAALDLAWTAAGRYDGYWERNLKPWDLAAGLVILREAGGIATDTAGGERILETGNVVSGNKEIVKGLLPLLAATPAAA